MNEYSFFYIVIKYHTLMIAIDGDVIRSKAELTRYGVFILNFLDNSQLDFHN